MVNPVEVYRRWTWINAEAVRLLVPYALDTRFPVPQYLCVPSDTWWHIFALGLVRRPRQLPIFRCAARALLGQCTEN